MTAAERPMDANSDDAFVNAWIAALPADACRSPSGSARTIKLVYTLESEWSNGGFHQFFKDPAGNDWVETLAALEQIGALRLTKLFESALAVFPGSAPSADQVGRTWQLDDAGSKAIETLDRLDDEYMALHDQYPNEDSYAKMAAFLRRHGEGLTTRYSGPGPREGRS